MPSATGHLFIYPAAVPGPYQERLSQELIAQVTAVKPRFIIYVKGIGSWLHTGTSLAKMAQEYVINNGYRLIGTVDIFPNQPSTYVFGFEQAKQQTSKSNFGVLVMEKIE